MNRVGYFDYIQERLATLSTMIVTSGKLNLQDLNVHSETFFADLLNQIFDWKLANLNTDKPNVEGIDLVDEGNTLLAQVSSTCTKQKIENSLEKELLKSYNGYTFKFVSIARDASGLRKQSYQNPSPLAFAPPKDIIDLSTMLFKVKAMEITKQKQLYDFIRAELSSGTDLIKVDTNLAIIINILSKEKLNESIDPPELNACGIENKIDFNGLSGVRETINDYKVHFTKINNIYSTFDKEGYNKSFSVLQIIRKQYIKRQNSTMSPSDIFYSIITDVMDIVTESKNYVEMKYDELELCVNILVVDAFIRCKIFTNPEGYNYAITR
jgi:hypothetical protein